MRTLIIIPAYNEAENISAVIGEVRSLYPSTALLVVDDGSADTTAALAERAGAKVVRLPGEHDTDPGRSRALWLLHADRLRLILAGRWSHEVAGVKRR